MPAPRLSITPADPFWTDFFYTTPTGETIKLILLDEPDDFVPGIFKAAAQDSNYNEYEITWTNKADPHDWTQYDVRLTVAR